LKWQRPLKSNLILALANNTSVETNVNYGRRKIVPDARTAESGLSVYLEHRLPEATLEYGLGAGIRFTKTLPTPTVNTDEKDIDPFQKTFPFFSGMAGVSFFPDQKWNLKMNLATGVRTPNLAELSSDGLHEGIYTYEIGDPYMKNEQNINGDIGVYYSGRCVQFSTSGFYNHFNGYIFLDPTDEEWFGFPIFRYRQHDARIYGGEAEISATLLGNGLKISASYSGLVGKLDNGDYLPYMPAQKITPEIRYELNGKNRSYYGFVNSDFVLQQNLVNPRENETPAYRLVNAGIGAQLSRKRTTYALQLAANNLLNEAYYDHLSRLKNFGLLNMGRDISLNLKINFRNKLNKK